MFITSFGEQNITYKCCSNFLIHLFNKDLWDSEKAIALRKKLDAWGKNKETELDKIDIEISLRAFKRSKK